MSNLRKGFEMITNALTSYDVTVRNLASFSLMVRCTLDDLHFIRTKVKTRGDSVNVMEIYAWKWIKEIKKLKWMLDDMLGRCNNLNRCRVKGCRSTRRSDHVALHKSLAMNDVQLFCTMCSYNARTSNESNGGKREIFNQKEA